MKKYTVIWSLTARSSLKKIHDFIKKKSPNGALKVVNELFLFGQKLEHFPNGHPVDTRLIDEPIVYRVISKWSYQIIYTVEEQNNKVIIVQVFASKKDPGKFKL